MKKIDVLGKSVLMLQWAEAQGAIKRIDHVAMFSRDARLVAVIGKHQIDVDFSGVMLNRDSAARIIKGALRGRLHDFAAGLRRFLEDFYDAKPEEFEAALGGNDDAALYEMPSEAERAIFGSAE